MRARTWGRGFPSPGRLSKVSLTSSTKESRRMSLFTRRAARAALGTALAAITLTVAGCSSSASVSPEDGVVVYSGRSEESSPRCSPCSRRRPASRSRPGSATVPSSPPSSSRRGTRPRRRSSSPRTPARSAPSRRRACWRRCLRGSPPTSRRPTSPRWHVDRGDRPGPGHRLRRGAGRRRRGAEVGARPDRPGVEGAGRDRADERLLPVLRDRDAADRG